MLFHCHKFPKKTKSSSNTSEGEAILQSLKIAVNTTLTLMLEKVEQSEEEHGSLPDGDSDNNNMNPFLSIP